MVSVWGQGEGKYGNGRGHSPRCDCPDCNAKFLDHNRSTHCGCIDCAYHREISAPQPPVTYQSNRYDSPQQEWRYVEKPSNQEPFPGQVLVTGKTVQGKSFIQRAMERVKRVATINICERPGCNALIKGDAMGLVDFMPNTNSKTERKGFELCPPCSREVYNLLHSSPIEGRERAYDKPFIPEDGGEQDDVKAATAEQLLAELIQREMRKQQRELEAGNG